MAPEADDLLDEGIRTQSVTVGTSATPLPAAPLENRQGILIQNLGASDLFIGGSNVTTSNGVKVAADRTFSEVALGPGVSLYGIVASGSVDVRVMETA